MRVGVGVILSVLSSSVLAAVIPNYDDHGLSLVRRTVNTDTRFVLWKRAGEEQAEPGPSSSGAGASTEASTSVGGSSLGYSSDNRGVSKLGGLRAFFKKLYMKLKMGWYTQGQRIIWNRGEKLVKNAVKRVTEAVEGGEAKQVLLELKEFLNITLKASQVTTVIFNSKTTMPLLLSNPKGDNQKSFLKEMTKMKKIGKGHAKKYFEEVTHAITAITKRPQDVVTEIEKIAESISRMVREITAIYTQEYKNLLSKVGSTGNEKNIENTQLYISNIQGYQKIVSNSFKYIKSLINNGGVTFKVRARSKFSTFKSGVRNRLGIKKKSSTGVPLNPGELDQEELDQDSLYQGELNLGPSNQRPPGQGPSKQGPPGQQAPELKFLRPVPVWV
ncbi:hypothetical protein BASA50_007774 [Batrachochytrium salamandrivorans]|uniref:SXP/RAL-2 family protein Ani s 5-like cation-binding domain-containing protein n=1 Tax=Batrachochytrium salamandrivorans TaxID=1357716 RepID=A0ABQ8F679_9FUNG|nr:hypothetical protein BASA50_007774 [Batrachochytrium salamandrivorans]